MKYECPYCSGVGKLQTGRINIIAQDSEMFPVKCTDCGKEFAVSLIISKSPYDGRKSRESK